MNQSNTSQREHYSNKKYSTEKNSISTSMKNIEINYIVKTDEYRVSTEKSREKEKIMKANQKLRMAGI